MWWDCLSHNVQLECCSQTVGHKENMWWESLLQNIQCHSLAVGHRKRCDETTFQRMCNVIFTHKLLAITGRYVMRLPYIECAMPLTSCWPQEKMWWDCLSHSVQLECCSLASWSRSQENMWWDCLSQMCNVTHNLLVIGKKWWDCLS